MTTTISETSTGTFPSFTSLRLGHSELLKKFRAKGETPEIIQEIKDFINRARATGELIDDESDRDAAQSLLDYWATMLFRIGTATPETTLAEFNPNLAPELDDSLCPYRGLNAFNENDWGVFFGRQRLIESLINHLRTSRLLCVVGPSGSGKSSVVRAGLIPALKDGAIQGSQKWEYLPTMVPGSKPLQNLTRILRPGGVADKEWEEQQIAALQNDSKHLLKMLSNAYQQPVVLVIDQFEEAFTLCTDTSMQRAFIDNLMNVFQSPDEKHIVILTMRADFENKIALLPDFQPYFEKNLVRVAPLNASELRSAIEDPARCIGLKFEEGVVDGLLNDILGEPAALPLLQFTLLKLWESRERNRVTYDSFRRLGGARQALARSADEFYNNLIPEEQVTARRILLRLVRPGEGLEITSNRLRRDELYTKAEASDRIDRVLEKFVKARLLKLTQGDDPSDDQVEVAHEALVRNWPTLVSWLEEERENIRERQRLTIAAERWQSLNRDPSLLIRGRILEEALGYEDLNELERAFVTASEKAQENEIARLRRRNQVITIFGIFALMAAIAAILLFFQSNANAQRAQAANTQIAQQIITVEAANDLAISGQATAVAANQLAQAQKETAVFLKNLAEQRQSTAEAGATQIAVQATEVSLKATAVATAQDYGNQQNQLARLRLGEQAASIAAEQPDLGALLALEAYKRVPDTVASTQTSYESLGKLMDALSAQPYLAAYLRGSPAAVTKVTFRKDSDDLVSSSANGSVLVWDTSQRETIDSRVLSGFAELNSVAFNTERNILAAGGCGYYDRTGRCTSGLIRFTTLEREGNQEINISAHQDTVTSVAFSPRGDLLISGGADGRVFVWSVPLLSSQQTTFSPQLTFIGHEGRVTSVAFSPNGRLLASAGIDGSVLVRSVSSAQIVATYTDPKRPVYSLAFTPDGQRLVIGREDGTILLVNTTSGQIELETKEHSTAVQALAIDQSQTYLASGSRDGTVLLWDLGSLTAQGSIGVLRLGGHQAAINSLAFNSDASLLASGSADETIILWNPESSIPFLLASHQAKAEIPSLYFTEQGLRMVDENGLLVELDYRAGIEAASASWPVIGRSRQLSVNTQGAFFDYEGNLLGQTSQSRQSSKRPLGLDVSEDQGIIDWTKVRAEPFVFVYTRATVGLAQDSQFLRNWEGIQAAGKLRGAYHVFDPSQDPEAQAKEFLSMVTLQDGDLPPVLEFLELGGNSTDQVLRGLETWMTLVEQLTGLRPILRTSPNLWNRISETSYKQIALPQFSQHPLWVVEYGTGDQPTLPSGWSTWTFWQYTDAGRSQGIPAPFVLSRFNGSQNSLKEFIQQKTASAPPVEQDVKSIDTTQIIDLLTREVIGTPLPIIDVASAALSPDRNLIAVGGKNGTIAIFSARTGEKTVSDFPIGTTPISSLIFDPFGNYLAAANEEGLVVYISLKGKGLTINNLSGHIGKVTSLAFSPDGNLLASGGVDGRIYLWDTQTLRAIGKPLVMYGNDAVTALAFERQGRLLAAATEFFEIQLFNLDPAALQFQACELAGRNLTQAEWSRYFPSEPYSLTCPQIAVKSDRFVLTSP